MNALANAHCNRCNAYNPIDYKISDTTIVQPDILIVCGNITKPYLDFPPALVVEIFYNTTALRDRNVKCKLYEQEGVPYYLITDIKKKTFEVYQLEDGAHKLLPLGNYTFNVGDGCNISPNLLNIWGL